MPEEEGILIASGIPPVRVRMPRLDEPKVLGTRNPLYSIYKQFASSLKPKLLAEILITQRITKGSNEPGTSSTQDQSLLPLTFEGTGTLADDAENAEGTANEIEKRALPMTKVKARFPSR